MIGIRTVSRNYVRLLVIALVASCPVNPIASVATAAPPSVGRIVFQASRDAPKYDRFQLYRVNADGSGLIRLTDAIYNYWFPSVSPDGKHVAFSSDRAGEWALFTMDIDGNNITQLTHGITAFYQAAWSPDAKKLAFTSEMDIYVINADGTQLINLTHNPANDQRPSWSPDGKKIAFASSRDNFTPNNSDSQIYVMNSDGSQPVRLIHWGVSSTFPKWSPDGKSIAFVLYNETYSGLYLMDTSGSVLRKVSNDGFMAAWSPDSQYLAMTIIRRPNWPQAMSTLTAVHIGSGQEFKLLGYDGELDYLSWGP